MAKENNSQFPGISAPDKPAVNCNFLLRVDGIYDLPCKKIGSIVQELEYDAIQEGGVNDYVHLRRKPVSHPYTLEIERYIYAGYFDPLTLGKRLEMPLVLYVSRYAGRFIKPIRTFTFSGCVVTGKTYGELEAAGSGLLTETTKISYQRLEVETNRNEKLLAAKRH